MKSVSGVILRPARASDYEFALGLYLEGTKRLLTKLGRWDEERVTARFKHTYKSADTRILCLNGTDIGWMQVSEAPSGFHLHQIHIIEGYRNRKLGTHLIKALQDRACAKTQPITLYVIRGNPALALYRRLGFRVIGGDGEKIHMRWQGRWSCY